MNIYKLDKDLFLKHTGTDFYGELGDRFKRAATRSLLLISEEINQTKSIDSTIPHRLKGVALSCGFQDVGRVCIKLESYSCIMNEKRFKAVMSMILFSMCQILSE